MKRDNKKALYESIMSSVAREVKKVLNESDFENINNHEINEKIINVLFGVHSVDDFIEILKSDGYHVRRNAADIINNIINTFVTENNITSINDVII